MAVLVGVGEKAQPVSRRGAEETETSAPSCPSVGIPAILGIFVELVVSCAFSPVAIEEQETTPVLMLVSPACTCLMSAW